MESAQRKDADRENFRRPATRLIADLLSIPTDRQVRPEKGAASLGKEHMQVFRLTTIVNGGIRSGERSHNIVSGRPIP